ncbi:M48 family metalloprotease [Sphingobacterium sp. LRF_L2]|uniref:M48 family metalloprotease n=1 Tax=Sphingobacterium sp. LRF_L2 TaxID=3369421 RepID=UPI003F60AC6A
MKIQTSKNFKKHAKKNVLSIVIFAFTYLFLLILAIALTVGFTLAGLWIFLAKPMLYTGILCIGLFASGLSVLFFLVKFIFASTKVDTGNLIEISAENEPQLFSLIHEVVNKVETNFPKKVFLSHDVNASVFYNSSFWSMFLPIRKNLQIGMGLINAVTQQELKAILAHEFGHFSQRSMKVGSYVYHVNQIIYNMLYRNESLDRMFEKWSNATGYATLFISISVFIMRQIQNILKKLYEYINLNYMALSREMEFHADEIAAHVAGSEALADSLLRLSFANHALETVLDFYQQKINVNICSENIYPEHLLVMRLISETNRYTIQNGFPQIQLDTIKKYNKSKLNLENQWASHPSNEDRVSALMKLNIIITDIVSSPAILLLSNNAAISKVISDHLFSSVQYKEVPVSLTIDSFQTAFHQKLDKYRFDQAFNDFYNYTSPILEGSHPQIETHSLPIFEDLFSNDKMEEVYELNALQHDKAIVEAINKGEITVKTFDYGGIKYTNTETNTLLQHIDQKLKELEDQLKHNHQQIFHYFLNRAKAQHREAEFSQRYTDFEYVHKNMEIHEKFYDELIENTRFIFETTPFAEIESRINDLVPRENRLKKELNQLLKNQILIDEMDEATLSSLQKYISIDLSYFQESQYNDDDLALLFLAISSYKQLQDDAYFFKKKDFLTLMLNLEHAEQGEATKF